MRFYLDHNIYIYSLNDESIGQAVETLKSDSVQFLYSPAHIEEVYTAFVKNGSKYQQNIQRIFEQISKFTDDMECLPSDTQIIIKREKPSDCYKRVAGIDTTQRMESDSKYKYQIDKGHYQELCKQDKHFQSISTLTYDKIWDHKEIINCLEELNRNMPQIINRHNFNVDTISLAMLGINKILPEDLQIQRGMYDELKKSHKALEFVVEILFRVLNISGYNADKEEATTISGIHDVTHAIYATKADKLFSSDKKFVNKCAAIYYFLGVKTQVVLCPQKEIAKILLESK